MSRPTDRQLLEDMHARVCNPVLFPNMAAIPERSGPLMAGVRYVTPVNLGNVAQYALLLETEVVDRISFRYRWKWDGWPSRDFFAQIARTPANG